MKYILDFAKWKCGATDGDSTCKTGNGITAMLNTEGYMCCLGQFAKQLGVPEEALLMQGNPAHVQFALASRLPWAKPYDLAMFSENDASISALASNLIDVNDCPDTTLQVKLDRLRMHLRDAGHELEIINLPEHLS